MLRVSHQFDKNFPSAKLEKCQTSYSYRIYPQIHINSIGEHNSTTTQYCRYDSTRTEIVPQGN